MRAVLAASDLDAVADGLIARLAADELTAADRAELDAIHDRLTLARPLSAAQARLAARLWGQWIAGRRRIVDDWLTRPQVAAELGVAAGTLANMASRGEGPVCIRVGARVLYPRSGIVAWLDEQAEQKRLRASPRAGRGAPGKMPGGPRRRAA